MEISKDEPIYSISGAAKLLGISIATLRVYEKEGLIIPFKTEGNQRHYSQVDLERVECIRAAINEKKISVNGIKAIYSLIPCWEVVQCSEEDRSICGAYNSEERPCWTFTHPNTSCATKSCRDCEVYYKYSNCGTIKNLLKNLLHNMLGKEE